MRGAKRLHGTSLAMLALSMLPQEARTAVAAAPELTFTVAGCEVTVPLPTRSPGMVDEFFEPGPLHVFRPAPPPALQAWGPEPKRLQPLNALGARVATLALRMGLARLLELRPATDDARRWGVAIRRTNRERILAALDTMREDAMIAAAIEPLREEARQQRARDGLDSHILNTSEAT